VSPYVLSATLTVTPSLPEEGEAAQGEHSPDPRFFISIPKPIARAGDARAAGAESTMCRGPQERLHVSLMGVNRAHFLPIAKYLASEIDTMVKNAERPGILRFAAAVILGCITGTILFLVVAMGIGVVNDTMGMQIPINLLVAENIFSAILLILFILACVAGLCWQARNTHTTDRDL
jgi:hypothetical protein